MKTLTLIIAVVLMSVIAHGESRLPYAKILKVAVIKKSVEIDGKLYFRAYLKANNSTLDINTVRIHLERNGAVIKTLPPKIRTITDNSLSKDHPWEILLPLGKEYEDTELVNNLEPGSLHMALSANINGNIFSGKTEINND
jgi:hypothetical protein